MHRIVCLSCALALTALSSAAFAQAGGARGGTSEQCAACGPDVAKLCANVDRNDRAAIPRCLGLNRAKLFDACRKALKL